VPRHHHSLVREGFLSGIIGAAVVAVWFLVSDFVQGRPLSTPSVLGQVVLYQSATPTVSPAEPGPVLAYTLFHLGAFVIFGILLTQLVHLAMSSPLARFGLLVIAVCFELFFVFMTYAVFHETSYLFPWWSVLAANTLSLGAMGIYLYRRHPGLRLQYQREPLGG
jgi:hypothetical protein